VGGNEGNTRSTGDSGDDFLGATGGHNGGGAGGHDDDVAGGGGGGATDIFARNGHIPLIAAGGAGGEGDRSQDQAPDSTETTGPNAPTAMRILV
jgi:hypothetical protein